MAGCNPVFGLDPTHFSSDVRPPAMCPPFGTPLMFARATVQVGSKYCWDYSQSPDAQLAVAMCREPNGLFIEQGPIDGELERVTEIDVKYDHPRLSPEGDELIVRDPVSPAKYYRLTRSGGTWQAPMLLAIGSPLYISTPSRGGSQAARRLIAVDPNRDVRELEGDGSGGWRPLRTYTAGALAPDVGPPGLSEDGKRLLLTTGFGPTELFVADRADLASPLAAVGAVTGVSNPQFGVYLTADCGRLYFSQLDTGVFYAPQP